MSLQYAVITFALPLWIATETSAPRWMVGAVLLVNTLGVVALQVWVGRKVKTVSQGAAAMRVAGLVFLVACVGSGGGGRPAGVGRGRGPDGGGGRPLGGRDVPRGGRVRAEFRAGAGPRAERVRGPAGHGPRRRVCGGARGARCPVPRDRAGRLGAARRAARRGGSGDRARRPVGGPKPALPPRVGAGPRPGRRAVHPGSDHRHRSPVRRQSPLSQTTVQMHRRLEYVVLDDNSRFTLDRDCVVGRDPHDCDAARRGLRPIRIDVRANGMSRAHLEIRRVYGRVFIIDRQSRNGVAIRPAGQTQWIRIAPWKPIVWLPGMSVRIGSRILRLEAAGQRPTVRNEPITVRMATPPKPPSESLTVHMATPQLAMANAGRNGA